LLQGLAVDTDVMNQVNMMSRVLMSRPNLEKVAQETDLALRASTPQDFQRMIDSLPNFTAQQNRIERRHQQYFLSDVSG
jgi:hypothetical protein